VSNLIDIVRFDLPMEESIRSGSSVWELVGSLPFDEFFLASFFTNRGEVTVILFHFIDLI
jgi:hypothetical protein